MHTGHFGRADMVGMLSLVSTMFPGSPARIKDRKKVISGIMNTEVTAASGSASSQVTEISQRCSPREDKKLRSCKIRALWNVTAL
jgi:hypothetical protein